MFILLLLILKYILAITLTFDTKVYLKQDGNWIRRDRVTAERARGRTAVGAAGPESGIAA